MNHSGGPISRETIIPSDLAAARALQVEIEESLLAAQFSDTEIFAIKMAIEEALVNAIKHGNQFDPEKRVTVHYTTHTEHFEIMITDEGPGFNPEDVPDPTDIENIERPCGRGLLLMRFYMTEVSFAGKGNTIQMCKRRNGTK